MSHIGCMAHWAAVRRQKAQSKTSVWHAVLELLDMWAATIEPRMASQLVRSAAVGVAAAALTAFPLAA